VASLLDAGDRLGVIAFDSTARTILPISEASPADVGTALTRLEPSGGTRILPALARAFDALGPTGEAGSRVTAGARHLGPSGARHLVLVTDGRGEGGDFEREGRRIAQAGVTLSVIAVGADADVPLLQALAAAGRGRFEAVHDASRLASALRREVVMARGPVVHEGRVAISAAPHPVMAGLAPTAIPPLLGYVSTAPKPFATVALRAETGDPVLAIGASGLGRAAVLTTTLDGPWSTEWRQWAGGPRLLTQLLGWLRRAPVRGTMVVGTEQRDGEGLLVVHVENADGSYVDGRVLRARVARSGAPEEVVPLEQRGPGVYAAALTGPVERAEVIVEDDTGPDPRVAGRGWLGLGYSDELRIRGPNHRLLDALRDLTGGRSLEGPASRLELRDAGSHSIALAPWLAAAGLGLFLLDLCLPHLGGAASLIAWSRAGAVR
jgi:Ca-activated chloride channel homolog